MDFATTLGHTIGNAASGASAAAASMPQKKQPRMNQKQFREMLLASIQQAGGNDMRPLPSSRATGGTRKRGESDLEFRFRMNQGLPRGARSGAGGGLDEQLFMEEGMSQDEARRKALILRSQGGEAFRDKEGKLQVRGKDTRKAVTSSTGRAYDPAAARKEFLASTKKRAAFNTSVGEKVKADALAAEQAARKTGARRSLAGPSGIGFATELSAEDFAKRPAAMITEGRNNPVTNKLTEVLGWMDKDQQAAGMPASGFEDRLRNASAQRQKLLSARR